VEYLDLAGIKEPEAVKRLLGAVGATQADKKETEPLPVSAVTRDEILAKRKRELDQLLDSTIKHNYHMKLDLEHEVEKEVEVKSEETGKKEKRKQWVWEPVPLETVLKDGQNYILVNPSGLGKTTFLTYAAGALLDRDAHYPFLPLFFTCIGLNSRAGTIENFIRRQVESVYSGTQGTLVSGEWENLCVLMDALDQARDTDDIVSSRQNTADKVKEGFAKIRLKLPEAGEVQHYLGEENYKKLAGIIEASGELVKAPVLLEMLKTITEKGHVVSTLYNRAGLYTEFTKILLDQERTKPRFWQDRLSISHFIDYELEQALEKVAFFSLVDNEILEIPKEKLVQYCESAAKKEALLNIGIILEFFEDREQKIVFRHQSFQAYFAARDMYYKQPQLFNEIVSDIAFFYNDVWYEVMRFFVGLEKVPQKAEAIIDLIYQTDNQKGELLRELKFIFSVFLMSEALVDREFIQRIYKKLRELLNNNKKYLDFFILNTDKFNKGNDEQRKSIFLIFEDAYADDPVIAVEVLMQIVTTKDIPLLEPLLRNEYCSRDTAEAIEQIYKRSTPELCIDRVLPTKKKKKVLPVQTFSAQVLHILHISDIHYALEKDPTITCIFHEFLQDIQKWRAQQNNTKIHSICLTGDIAQSGQENHNHNPKPWYNRKLKDFPVRVIGLNSALFCIQGFSEYGKIRMGTHPFQEAYFQGKLGDRRDHELVILLTHHPVNWLAENEYDKYSTLMERYSVIHLHGHIHKTIIVKKQKLFSSSGGYVSIGTGSLYGKKGKEDINTYHIITFDFENQELHVWAKRWNPDSGKWTVYDDDGNNRFPFPHSTVLINRE
jgi:predicted MPP superfamily phosphohydrolase